MPQSSCDNCHAECKEQWDAQYVQNLIVYAGKKASATKDSVPLGHSYRYCHLQGLQCPREFRPSKMRTLHFLEMHGCDHPLTQRHTLEERNPQLPLSKNLKFACKLPFYSFFQPIESSVALYCHPRPLLATIHLLHS
jgi:hypothetical protein